MTHPNDQHVIPEDDAREHEASVDCWCGPGVDDGVPHPSGARVWIHHRAQQCGQCGAVILGHHACEGVP